MEEGLRNLVPKPVLLVDFSDPGNLPSAAELTIDYPDQQVSIVSAYEAKQLGQGSMVRITDVDTDTVKVQFLDPDAMTESLALVLDVSIPEGLDPNDFVITEQTSYLSDGSLAAGTWSGSVFR